MTCVALAPGRVNLIGEHTDYNDGFVLPIALDRATQVTAVARGDRRITARSNAQAGEAAIDLDRLPPARSGSWIDYVAGVAAVLDRTTRLRGADLDIGSDVPLGAGLSSSASLEVACGLALLHITGASMDRTALARACQQAEHEFVGTRCGLMDQFVACHARRSHALLLDTRSLEFEHVPLPSGISILVCNTMVRHHLATAQYNARRADCEQGARALAAHLPDVRALRDVSLDDLESSAAALDQRIYRRCRHVVTENDRVLAAARALASGDAPALGRLLAASHASLRDDFEVSCRELDVMVEIVSALGGVYGARMTGGGFGGCAIAVVDTKAAAAVIPRLATEYASATGIRPDIWVTSAGDGAAVD